jgi:hypothetical protein
MDEILFLQPQPLESSFLERCLVFPTATVFNAEILPLKPLS